MQEYMDAAQQAQGEEPYYAGDNYFQTDTDGSYAGYSDQQYD